MKLALTVALASLLFNGAAHASTDEIEVSTAVVCNTQKQVEEFVAFDNGDWQAAVRAVNVEERDPSACAVASIVFVRGHDTATVRTGQATFRIAPILIIGVMTSAGMRTIDAPAVQFAPFKIDERPA